MRNEHVNAIITRSGKTTGPAAETEKSTEKNRRASPYEDGGRRTSQTEDIRATPSTEGRRTSGVQDFLGEGTYVGLDTGGKSEEVPVTGGEKADNTSEPAKQPEVKAYKPTIPYPQRLRKEQDEERKKKFIAHLGKININLPFLDAISQIPGYAKFLKQVLSNKKVMETKHVEQVMEVSEASSDALTGKLPKKRSDPGQFTIPCQLGDLMVKGALTDTGASINLMPMCMYDKLNLGTPKFVNMRIKLADKSEIRPVGMLEDVKVKVGNLIFPADFVLIHAEEESQVPLILGRPFLATADANVEVGRGKLTLRTDFASIMFENSCVVKTTNDMGSVSVVKSQVKGSDVRKMEKKISMGENPPIEEPKEPSTKVRKLYTRVKSAIARGNKKLLRNLTSNLSGRQRKELAMVVEMTNQTNEALLDTIAGTDCGDFDFLPPDGTSMGEAEARHSYS